MADTAHFDTREIGAYLLILFAMWRTRDVRLKLNDKELSLITKLTPQQWAKMRPKIFALPGWDIDYSEPGNAHFTHKKLEQTRMRARKTRDVNRANAKQRWKG